MRNISVLLLTGAIGLGWLAAPLGAQAPVKKPEDPAKVLADLLLRVKDKDKENIEARVQVIMGLADFGPQAEPALPELLEALQSKEEDLRLNAAIALAKIGKAAIAPVSKLLAKADDDTRFYALWTIGWIGPDAREMVPTMIKLMTDKNEGIRRKAAYALGRLAGDPEQTIKVLVEAFKDESDEVRQAAGEALSKFGKASVPPLIQLLQRKNEKAQLQASQSLGEIGSEAKEAVPLLKELFLAPGNHAQHYGQVLAKIGKAAMPALEAGFKDARAEVRQAACQAMSQIGADAVPVLVDALGDKNVEVRRLAAQTLWPMRIGDKMVVTALAYALQDEDDAVRQLCMQALLQLGPQAKLGSAKIKEALTDMNQQIRQQAFSLLQSFGEDLGPTMQKALASKNDKVRINTACLMLNVNYQTNLASPVVVEALKNEDLGLRMQAAFTLAQRQEQTDKLLPLFIEGVKHPAAGVRIQAVQGLALLRNSGDKAATVIAEAIQDKDASVRQHAINAMHSVPGSGPTIVPILTKVYKTGDAGIRQSVMQIAWRYGASARGLISEGLKEKESGVRQQALYALQNLQGEMTEMIPVLVDLLKDKESDDNVRVQASQLLRNMGPRAAKAVPALKELANDRHPTVRINIMLILATVGGEGIDMLIKHYHEEKDADVRLHLVQGLVYSDNPKRALPLVKISMKDPSTQVRQNTINALNVFGQNSPEAFELFTMGLKDSDMQVRTSAAYMANLYGTKSWGPLEEALKDAKDGNMRQAVLQSLQQTQYRSKTGFNSISACLKDSNPTVRLFACNLLGNLGADATDALPRLHELTKDANPAVQQSARAAIQRIESVKK